MECNNCSHNATPEYEIHSHRNLQIVDCRCTNCYKIITSDIMGIGGCLPDKHVHHTAVCRQCSTTFCNACSYMTNCPVCGCPEGPELLPPVPDVDIEHPWIPLEFRVTHKYNDGAKGEDLWIEIGQYRVLGRCEVPTTDNDSETQVIIVQTHSWAQQDVIIGSFEESFSKGCTCEHDCCGCMNGSPSSVEQIGDSNIFAIHRTLYRNV